MCLAKNNPDQQKTSSVTKSSDVASSMVSTTKKAPEDSCPFTPVEGIRKNITCFLSEM